MRNGQVFSADLVIAMVIFIMILLISVWADDYVKEKRKLDEKVRDLEILSENALSVLVSTPGHPAGWSSEPDSIGITDHYVQGVSHGSYCILNRSKIGWMRMNYALSKDMMGIRGPAYEYHLLIYSWNSTDYSPEYSIGKEPTDTAEFVIRKDRMALLDGDWTRLVLKVWQNCTRC